MMAFDGVKHRPVKRIQSLIAASAGTGVENRIGGFAREIRVTRVNYTEISQKRNYAPAALINSVTDFVNLADFAPRKNPSGLKF